MYGVNGVIEKVDTMRNKRGERYDYGQRRGLSKFGTKRQSSKE
jgi:hypothetical protein